MKETRALWRKVGKHQVAGAGAGARAWFERPGNRKGSAIMLGRQGEVQKHLSQGLTGGRAVDRGGAGFSEEHEGDPVREGGLNGG